MIYAIIDQDYDEILPLFYCDTKEEAELRRDQYLQPFIDEHNKVLDEENRRAEAYIKSKDYLLKAYESSRYASDEYPHSHYWYYRYHCSYGSDMILKIPPYVPPMNIYEIERYDETQLTTS